MSWLDDIKREFMYECEDCGSRLIESQTTCEATDQDKFRLPRKCECGGVAGYVKTLPLQFNLATKVAFEHNGVKGYVISDGKGGVQYRAASKDKWMDTGEVKPQYTPAYEAHLRKTGQGHMLQGTNSEEILTRRKQNKELKKEYDSRIQAAKDSNIKG